jgi:hypothetical protein
MPTKHCKIVIHDQCNASFVGLDPTTRRACNKALKFFIHAARHTPAYRLGRWDGCVSFFAINGNTFVNVLEKVWQIIIDAGYTFELEDHRPDHNYEFPEIDTEYFSDAFPGLTWPKHHPAAGQPIILRDYQVEVIKTALANKQSVQEISTGSGKTIICAALSHLCEQHGRTIIIVPNKDLVKQTLSDYENIGLDVGVYFGEKKDYKHKHVICTWQSLDRLIKTNLDGSAQIALAEFVRDVACVIVDECFAAGTLVATPEGHRAIEDFKPGDAVYSVDEDTGEIVEDSVVRVHTNLTPSIAAEMYELEMEDGTFLHVTGNHKVKTTSGWKQVQDLSTNDEIVDIEIKDINEQKKRKGY